MPYSDGRHHLDAGDSWKLSGSDELMDALLNMAMDVPVSKLTEILNEASEPMLQKMRDNAPVRSGRLKRDLARGRIVRHQRTGKLTITLGVHKGYAASRYAHLVEDGHGGPHPAPPHPFMRLSFDATADESYGIMREKLQELFDEMDD